MSAQPHSRRQIATPLSAEVRQNLMRSLDIRRLRLTETGNGYVLEGAPRFDGQLDDMDEIFDETFDVDAVVYIERVSKEELERRMLARGRPDDTPETFARRWGLWIEESIPELDKLGARSIVIKLDGRGTPDEVFGRLWRRLGDHFDGMGS